METNFSNLQQLWQSQKAEEINIKSLISELQLLEKKQKRELIIGGLLIPITLIALAFILPWRENSLALFSLLLILGGMSWMLWLSAKSRVLTTTPTADFSNQVYVKAQLQQLQLRYTILKKHILIYGGLIALSINLGYLVVLDSLPITQRILIHLAGMVFLALVMWGSIWFQKRKYDKTLSPIIEKLERLLEK